MTKINFILIFLIGLLVGSVMGIFIGMLIASTDFWQESSQKYEDNFISCEEMCKNETIRCKLSSNSEYCFSEAECIDYCLGISF